MLSLTTAIGMALLTSVLAAPAPQVPGTRSNQRAVSPGRTSLRRLTRYEYNRSIRDLFGFDFNVDGYLPEDNSSNGFTNNAAVAFMTTDRISQYLAASKFVADSALGVNDFLTSKRRRWSAEEILADNPNETFKNRFKTFLADFANHVQHGQRMSKPPRLHLVAARSSDGHTLRALDLRTRSRLALHHDFPMTAGYTIDVIATSTRPDSNAELKILVDGNPVPLRIAMTPQDSAFGSHSLPVHVSRGKRSIEIAVASASGVRLTSIEIAGPTILDGPLVDGKNHRSLTLPCTEPATSSLASAQDCADRTIRYLASKAFRRSSIETAEVQTLLAPFQRAIEGGRDFRSALSLSVQAVLLSPRFLYRLEFAPSEDDPAPRQVDDFEFATRLSYFLWGSLPDETLLRLAERRQLVTSSETIRAQVERMLKDSRADALVDAFAGGWLGYTALRSHVSDGRAFPDFDEELRQAMLTETELYLRAFFDENWPIPDLLNSRTMFLNERLARHYGIETVKGPQFRRLESDSDQRWGLLTQGSILTITSNPNRTSIVQRGIWVLQNVLCESVGAPPPDVPALPQGAHVEGMPLRQQMEMHRINPACAGCHRRMDPLGFSFENYDGIGSWRSSYGGTPIDSSGTIATETGTKSFDTFPEFRALLKDDDRFPLCVTQKLMTYALGRSLSADEKATAKDILARTQGTHSRIHDVIAEIVLSPHFLGTSQN